MSTGADNGAGEPADVITSAGPSSLEQARERRERYVELEAQKRALAAQAKRIGAEMEKLGDSLLDDFAELGTDKLTAGVPAGELVIEYDALKLSLSIGHDLWAGPLKTGIDDKGNDTSTDEDWERACDALRLLGCGDMLGERFNSQSFSAWLREFRAEHGIGWRDELPEAVAEALRISDIPKVKVRKV